MSGMMVISLSLTISDGDEGHGLDANAMLHCRTVMMILCVSLSEDVEADDDDV